MNAGGVEKSTQLSARGTAESPSSPPERPQAAEEGVSRGEAGGANSDSLPLHPIFLKLAGRKVLVVGGGKVATGKARSLLEAGASVVVVAPDVAPEITRLGAKVERRRFEPQDLDGAWYVVAAATSEVNLPL